MKYLLLVMILLVSCHQPNVEKKSTTYILEPTYTPLQVMLIDSCQYLYGSWGTATVLTHKGNCTNPIHPEHLRHTYK